MATYLQLHILEGMTEDEVIQDGYDECYGVTECKTPWIIIAEYSYGWSVFGNETIPSCVDKMKELMLIKNSNNSFAYFHQKYKLVFAPLNVILAKKITEIMEESFLKGEGYRIINPDKLREFLDEHMGKKIFLIES